jgi:hypothetical protein
VGKKFKRGYNSSFVREPTGAAAYERASYGWDDFVQRAKLGGDIDPQMKEINQETPGPNGADILSLLIEASEALNQPPQPEAQPAAMFALADAATAELHRAQQEQQAKSRPSAHRTILPQPTQPQMAHGPTDPRSFLFPAPQRQQQQQQRRLLPAGQIPPINEQLGLRDPFVAPGGAPPQLPPPKGSNFQRYLPGPPLYYPPPPPPGPSPPGRRPPY